jgi:IS1 family transposase
MMRTCCPDCGSPRFKKNGHPHTKKQNHQCLNCGRQCVLEPEQKLISEEEREWIRGLLKERLSLRGICRAMKVRMDWLLTFISQEYEHVPEDMNVRIPDEHEESPEVDLLPVEGDELWSVVGKKANKPWIWLAQDRQSRQIIGMHVGDHGATGARGLWDSLPQYDKDHGLFYTDQGDAYGSVIPPTQHRACPKGIGKTNHSERFKNTLRQRVSRLVRKALSFSKTLKNHIGAITYFICDYNIEVLYA